MQRSRSIATRGERSSGLRKWRFGSLKRERLGAVNLRAEEELVEITAKHEGIVTERDDLVEAIKRLRQAIGSLNREGRDIAASPIGATQLGTLLDLIAEGTISGKIAKDVFEIVWAEGGDPREIVEARGLKQVTLSELYGGR